MPCLFRTGHLSSSRRFEPPNSCSRHPAAAAAAATAAAAGPLIAHLFHLTPTPQAISAAVADLSPQEVAAAILPLLKALLKDSYADVRAAALRQAPAVGELAGRQPPA